MDRQNRKALNICFVGLGSIAERHIKNINSIFKNREEKINIDLFRSGKGKKDLIKNVRSVYYDINDVPDDYDVVFITNPTNCHLKSLNDFNRKGANFFIEKPVFNGSNECKKYTAGAIKGIDYVACPLRYTKVIQYLKEKIDFSKIYSVRCISSSYLPDWRKNIDYRNCYSAKKELGGGVSIDLIHEWDYIQYLIGFPRKVYNIHGKYSKLEINSEDLSIYMAEYNDKLVELHLDYIGRKPVRRIELYGEDTITADLISGKVEYINKGITINLHEERDEYQKKELMYFFNAVKDGRNGMNDISMAMKVVSLAEGEVI